MERTTYHRSSWIGRVMKAGCVLLSGVLCLSFPVYAQKTISVTPQVLSETRQRLLAATTATFSQRAGKQDKGYMKACNAGPGSFGMSQIDSCEQYAFALHGNGARPDLSLDTYMPLYKACALDGTNEACDYLGESLLNDSKDNYFFALVASGKVSTSYTYRLNGRISLSPEQTSLQVTLNNLNLPVEEYVLEGSRDFVFSLLHSLCIAEVVFNSAKAARVDLTACGLAASVGNPVSSAEAENAAMQHQLAMQANDQADESARASSGGSQESLNAVLSALNQANSTIHAANSQEEANLAAIAAGAQPRQQAPPVAHTTNSSAQSSFGSPQPSYSQPANSSTSSTTASPQEGQCTDMSNSVSGTVKVNGNEVIAWLTNNSGMDLYVFYAFKQNGGPSHNLANDGAGSLYAGKTNGGELGGMYSYSADTNPAMIYWYAVPLAQKNANGCVHTW